MNVFLRTIRVTLLKWRKNTVKRLLSLNSIRPSILKSLVQLVLI
jgi:hypothetical protein